MLIEPGSKEDGDETPFHSTGRYGDSWQGNPIDCLVEYPWLMSLNSCEFVS